MKQGKMISLDITTYQEASKIIEYLTHLEGMGTYAPLKIHMRENAMGIDRDYVIVI
ncbi:MAG: hypothetical protein FWE34_01705 [Defluviitaleaceae bacterium]|nr:hypothetical protein [Defluviitaleaceae bacterium]